MSLTLGIPGDLSSNNTASLSSDNVSDISFLSSPNLGSGRDTGVLLASPGTRGGIEPMSPTVVLSRGSSLLRPKLGSDLDVGIVGAFIGGFVFGALEFIGGFRPYGWLDLVAIDSRSEAFMLALSLLRLNTFMRLAELGTDLGGVRFSFMSICSKFDVEYDLDGCDLSSEWFLLRSLKSALKLNRFFCAG